MTHTSVTGSEVLDLVLLVLLSLMYSFLCCSDVASCMYTHVGEWYGCTPDMYVTYINMLNSSHKRGAG